MPWWAALIEDVSEAYVPADYVLYYYDTKICCRLISEFNVERFVLDLRDVFVEWMAVDLPAIIIMCFLFTSLIIEEDRISVRPP